ncbi:3-oxoacyl-ACP synthase [uncultured Croceitalea sp.]|uniref:3-oxoacyl-ACP synthase n=1 Tax=uncultured Croceitalea sp. TaxID=1798908 RepID=UPI0033059817
MKSEAYQFCERFITARLQRIQEQIDEVKAALTSESKSTAGDKHETGRAMLQLEREKLGQQLLDAERIQQVLRKVPQESKKVKVVLGSLVKTDSVNYYIAISAGRVVLDKETVFCISANTPIAKLLLGKEKGDSFQFNGTLHKLLDIN